MPPGDGYAFRCRYRREKILQRRAFTSVNVYGCPELHRGIAVLFHPVPSGAARRWVANGDEDGEGRS